MEKTYAVLDNSTPQKVVNTVLWDSTIFPSLNFGGATVDLTGVTPQPGPPGQTQAIGQSPVPFHWTYDGTNFNFVTGS